MNIHWRREILSVFLSFIASVAAISVSADAIVPQRPPLAARKAQLSDKIDSLDLLKQHQKRLGHPITEIEQQQETLRDSLKLYRTRLQASPKTVSATSPSQSVGKFLKKPDNLFDWIIIITGSIALFSGLMLIVGILRTVSRKRRTKPRTKEMVGAATIPVGLEKPVPPAPAYPDNSAGPLLSHTTATPSAPDIGVTQLQRRIERYQTTPGAYEAPKIPELPPLPTPASMPDEVADTASIESRVIAASRGGLDIATISRKFQISSDHVALILKMAGRNSPSR